MTWCPEVLIPQLRVQAEQAPYDSLKWQLNSLAHALEREVRGAGSGEVRGLFDRRTHTRQSPAHPHSSASSAEGLQPTEEPYLTSENAEPSAADNRTSHLFEVVREFLDLVEAFIDPPRPGKTGDIEH